MIEIIPRKRNVRQQTVQHCVTFLSVRESKDDTKMFRVLQHCTTCLLSYFDWYKLSDPHSKTNKVILRKFYIKTSKIPEPLICNNMQFW